MFPPGPWHDILRTRLPVTSHLLHLSNCCEPAPSHPGRRVKHNKIQSVIFIEQPFSQNRYTPWMGPAGRSFSSSQIVTVVAAFSPHLMRSGKVLRIWPIILCISSRCVPHHSHFSLHLARVVPGSLLAVIVMHLTFTPSQFWPLMDCSGSLLLGSREATSARHPVGHNTCVPMVSDYIHP